MLQYKIQVLIIFFSIYVYIYLLSILVVIINNYIFKIIEINRILFYYTMNVNSRVDVFGFYSKIEKKYFFRSR